MGHAPGGGDSCFAREETKPANWGNLNRNRPSEFFSMGGADMSLLPASARAVYTSIVILMAVIVVAVVTASAQTPSLDSQSLIGEWSGSWTTAGAVQQTNSGRYYLTIEKVEGERVHGKGRFEGKRATDFSFVGTLAGNRLRYGTNSVADLQVSGNHMRGKIQGRVNWDVELVKTK